MLRRIRAIREQRRRQKRLEALGRLTIDETKQRLAVLCAEYDHRRAAQVTQELMRRGHV